MSTPERQWFSAVVAYEIAVGGVTTDERSLSLVLVRASDENSANNEARRLGSEQNVAYSNSDGDEVTWRMSEVLDVRLIADKHIGEGTDVYSCFVSAELLEDIKKQIG